jgi:spermidine/putrescine-binding protein
LALRGTLPAAVLARFRDRYPAVTLRVVTVKNAVYAAQRLRGGLRADLIAARSDDNADDLVRERYLQPVDGARLAPWPDVYPVFRDFASSGGRTYLTPVTAGEIGIISRVGSPAAPRSFASLFRSRFKGRLAFPDNAAVAVQAASLALGFDAATKLTERQDERVRILLKGKRHWFRAFWDDPRVAGRLLASGTVDATVGTRAQMMVMERAGANLRFAPAREGQLISMDGFGIASSTSDPAAAYAFLAFLLEPKTQARLVVRTHALAVNRATRTGLPAGVVTRLGLDAPEHFSHPVLIAPQLDHVDWIQTWYAVKTGRACCL